MAPKRSGSTQKTDKLPTDLIKRMKSKLEYLVKTKNSEQAREVAKAYESGDHETKLSMLHEFQSDPSLSWSYKFTREISETHKIGSCSTEEWMTKKQIAAIEQLNIDRKEDLKLLEDLLLHMEQRPCFKFFLPYI